MVEQEKLKEAVSYFKAREGFHSLFLQLIDKYRSYGRFGGKVIINNPTLSEREHLSGFTGVNYSRTSHITLEIAKFENLLENSAYQGVDLKEVVELYFGTTLLTKKEEKARLLKEQEHFFSDVKKVDHKYTTLLTGVIKNKEKGTKGIFELYNKDQAKLKEILESVYRLFLFLPEKGYVRLPLLASDVTDNPHFFDMNTVAGGMLLQCLQIILYHTIEKEIISNPNTEETSEILDYFGIARDDISNNVPVYGMVELENNNETLLSKAINQRRKVMIYPLRELEDLKEVYGVGKKVFVIENSGVYSSIVDECQREGINATIVCSSGQLNLSVWLLLEKFAKNGNLIYYSGDHDPEGILMANRIKRKFEQKVVFWNFNVDSYFDGLSQEMISESRLKQLNTVDYSELKELVNAMQEVKKTGYQEKQKDKLFHQLKRYLEIL
jgi:uncharacterized protein (TIGR02679 family)